MPSLEERVRALEKRMEGLESRLSGDKIQPASRDFKKLSVKEFVLSKNPTNDVQRTLAIGYFLERYTGATSFNVDDLTRYFQLAKEAIPPNINDKVNLNIRKGHMAETKEKKDKKKAWIVTNSGERFVGGGFRDSE